MVAIHPDRPFAEVRPLYEAWAAAEATRVAPLEWAFERAGIPIRFVAGLVGSYGVAADALDLACAILPARLEHAAPAERATALRVCVGHWEEDGQYEACSRLWCALVAYVREERDT